MTHDGFVSLSPDWDSFGPELRVADPQTCSGVDLAYPWYRLVFAEPSLRSTLLERAERVAGSEQVFLRVSFGGSSDGLGGATHAGTITLSCIDGVVAGGVAEVLSNLCGAGL